MVVDLSVATNKDYKPTLNRVNQLLDFWIVGEQESRMGVFTNWILACQNVNLAGQRASGKTHIANTVSKFLPDKNGMFDLAKGSDKSSWYQAEALKQHSHIMIRELNKITNDVKETLKDWGEGMPSKYNVVVSEGGNRRVQTYVLPCKPFIFCLADEQEEKVDEQLRSRLTVIRTDISEAQNKSVNLDQANSAMMPTNPKPFNPEEFKQMKEHISTLPPWDDDGYRHPAANIFVGCIPTFFTDCRRDFPKYLKNTYGITRFYWKDRLSSSISTIDSNNKLVKKRIFFVTPQDMYYNHIIYGNTLVESSLKCSNMERQLIQVLQESKNPLPKSLIQSKIRLVGITVSSQMLSRHLATLSDLGYVETVRIGKIETTYTVGALFKDFQFEVNWKEVIKESIENMKKYYPESVDDYKKMYCDNPIVIHPYNGVEINLNDIEFIPPNKSDTLYTSSSVQSKDAPEKKSITSMFTVDELEDIKDDEIQQHINIDEEVV